MKMSASVWMKYINRLQKMNNTAANEMREWLNVHGFDDAQAVVDQAYALSTKYGEGAAALACEMCDEMAEYQGVTIQPAEPADTKPYEYVKAAVEDKIETGQQEKIPDTVGEIVKRTGAETTIKNAKRDGAYFAWVPHGDTCAFCIMLASNGWQRASKKTAAGDHVTHIHAHCDCEFAISYNGEGSIEGYDPDKYRDMYYEQEGSWRDRVNGIRRDIYQENKDKINAQKRVAYARTKDDRQGFQLAAGVDGNIAGTGTIVEYKDESLSDLRQKDREWAREEDAVSVNPGNRKPLSRKLNCSKCAPAYELRRRGLDVIALPSALDEEGNVIYDDSMTNSTKLFEGFQYVTAGSFDGKRFIELRLLESGYGARMQIQVSWKDETRKINYGGEILSKDASHTFIAENIDGEIKFIDPQVGLMDCSSYFTKVKNGCTMYCRIDDKKINEEYLKYFVINRGGE